VAETPIRVAIAGARGKTGSVVALALGQAPGIEIVGKLVRQDGALERDEFTDFAKLATDRKPAVLVDFTVFPDSKRLALQALDLGIRAVIGTSGYTSADLDELRAASAKTKIGIVYAPNFSIGAILSMQFAKIAAPYFTHAEIIETHGHAKKDAPSGTALATAHLIAKSGKPTRRPSAILRADGARGAEVEGVGIHSIRIPGAIAGQEVIFANDDETLVIRHVTSTRTAFVAGVIEAVHRAATLDHFVEGIGVSER
jgi:4-hydroxy-tetrahydrodipicolinate reductase